MICPERESPSDSVRSKNALASRKPLEKRPDRFRAVDVVVLRAQHVVHHARKTCVVETAGHAMAAVIDAVEHDVAPFRTARFNARHRALVRRVAVVEIGGGSIAFLAAIDLPPEGYRL